MQNNGFYQGGSLRACVQTCVVSLVFSLCSAALGLSLVTVLCYCCQNFLSARLTPHGSVAKVLSQSGRGLSTYATHAGWTGTGPSGCRSTPGATAVQDRLRFYGEVRALVHGQYAEASQEGRARFPQ